MAEKSARPLSETLDLSAIEDILRVMANDPVLSEIDAFLAQTGMGASYFGKKAVGNSEVVARLREGRRVWPETRDKLRAFIAAERAAPTAGDAA